MVKLSPHRCDHGIILTITNIYYTRIKLLLVNNVHGCAWHNTLYFDCSIAKIASAGNIYCLHSFVKAAGDLIDNSVTLWEGSRCESLARLRAFLCPKNMHGQAELPESEVCLCACVWHVQNVFLAYSYCVLGSEQYLFIAMSCYMLIQTLHAGQLADHCIL